MALTTANFVDLMKHALGKTPDSRHVLLDTFNRAGRALVNRHNWAWRNKENTAVAAVANTNYFTLPADFGAVRTAYIDASSNAGDFTGIRLATMEEIARLRQTSDGESMTGGVIAIAFPDYTSSTTDTTQPTPRAPCFPTPTTNGDPTFSLNYFVIWRECDQSASEVPNIPPEFEEALRLQATLFALRTENINGDYSQIQNDLDREISQLLVADARRQYEAGFVTGGAASRSSSTSGGRHPLALPITF